LLSPSIPIRPPPFSPLVHVVNRFLGNAAHGIVSFLLRSHAHLHQQREPAGLVVVEAILFRAVHRVLLLQGRNTSRRQWISQPVDNRQGLNQTEFPPLVPRSQKPENKADNVPHAFVASTTQSARRHLPTYPEGV
jgi:hypothetical protein